MKQRLLTTLTAALLALSAWANGTMIDGIYYELDSSTKTASVTYTGTGINKSYNPSSTAYTGSITIDAAVPFGGTIYTVTSIGDWAFRDCTGLTSITIPNSVTSIEFGAFTNCTGLTSITIPNSVTSIGNYAFADCTGLTSIIIPNSVTSIGDYAFYGCTGLTSIDIPNSVTSIGNYAFANCTGLTSISIPESVTSFGSSAFYDCTGLTSVTINNNNIVSKTYTYNSNLSNIFGSQVTTYILGDNVTSIGDYAFDDCTGLTSITIPNSVTSIGDRAFGGCTGLTSIDIPNSVTSIGSFAFLGCEGLTSINVAAGNTTYDSRDNCQAIIETASNTLIAGCMNSTIPNSVTSIGDNAFYGCTSLTSINIPNSVTSIGSSAFEGCASLTSITIPNSVTKINYRAFSGCTGLTDIYALRTGPDAYNCDTYAFEDITTSTCTLHVPQGSKEAYKTSEPWYRFEYIVEEDFASDLNGDYTVNVGDVTTLVNIILSEEGAEVEGFDLNGDGAVNVGDVTTLVNKILGK